MLFFSGLWLVFSGGDAGAWPPGLLAAGAATWTSLRLLPPSPGRIKPAALPGLVLRFSKQSLLGGMDVAWRALSPRLPLDPGFVACALRRLPPGPARNAFAAELSLLPGTLAAGMEGDRLVLHCLDRRQPVAELAEDEEARFAAALGAAGGGAGHG